MSGTARLSAIADALSTGSSSSTHQPAHSVFTQDLNNSGATIRAGAIVAIMSFLRRTLWRTTGTNSALRGTIIAILAFSNVVCGEPVLIDSIDRVDGSGRTGLTDPRAQLGIIVLSIDDPPVPVTINMILFSNSFLQDGESGVFEFDESTSSLFSSFAGLLTNGVDDEIVFITMWPESGQVGILGAPESFFFERSFGEPPDLVGFTLDSIRLQIRDVSIESFTVRDQDGLRAIFDYRYEFYGTPIPEPSTFVIAATGMLMMLRSLRRSDRADEELCDD